MHTPRITKLSTLLRDDVGRGFGYLVLGLEKIILFV
jgi:hypothetical protein